MTDDLARDPVVVDALRRLPTPDHGPTFWADLDRRLDLVDSGIEAADHPDRPRADRVVVPMVSVPPEAPPRDLRIATGELPAISVLGGRDPGRGRHTVPWLGAAAAVLVLAVGAAAFALQGGGGREADIADAPDVATTVADGTSAVPAPPGPTAPTPETTPGGTAGAPTPVAAVERFIAALGAGDIEAAAATLGPETLEFLEATFPAGAEGMLRESQEGLGAWADARDATYEATGSWTYEFGEVQVVFIRGTYPGEGSEGRRSDAFAVVDNGSGWLVEWLGHKPGTDAMPVFTNPGIGPAGSLEPLPPDGLIEVFFDHPGVVAFLVDGVNARTAGTTPVGADPAPYVNFELRGAFAPGEHELVLLFMSNEAVYAAGPFTLEVVDD